MEGFDELPQIVFHIHLFQHFSIAWLHQLVGASKY